jgi:hypothetical protein
MVLIVAALLAAPCLAAFPVGLFGPSSTSRPVRMLRSAAYGGVWVLLFVVIAVSHYGGQRFESVNAPGPATWTATLLIGALVDGLPLLGMFAGYCFLIFASTSGRSSTAAPGAVVVGAAVGVLAGLTSFAMAPFGHVLRGHGELLADVLQLTRVCLWVGAPLFAGWFAVRRSGLSSALDPSSRDWRPEGLIAGLWACLLGAVVLTSLTLGMMRLYPERVALRWANPDPNVPHGTPFERQMSVSDAAGSYLPLMILAPIVGSALGALFSRGEAPRKSVNA